MSEHFHSSAGRPAVRLVTALALALALAAAPGAAAASKGMDEQQVAASPAGDSPSIQAERVGTVAKSWPGGAGQPAERAWAELTVYWNHAKALWVCDRYNGDGIGLAIEIDPSGGGTPDTLVYYDRNGAAPGCLDHTIGYSVRKWRWVSVYQDGRIHDNNHPWRLWPLPRSDF